MNLRHAIGLAPMNLFFAITSTILFSVAAVAVGEPIRCAGTGIHVPHWSAEERDRVCGASAAAIAFLRAAGVPYLADDLTIRPMPGGMEENQRVIGCCDVLRNEILILTYDDAMASSRKFSPAFDLPMSAALWESFISHETAHAVAEQNFAAGVLRRTASEYIAAVVQLATLPNDLRKAILEHYRAQGFADASEISLVTYDFDPAVFAVMAYRHYVALGDEGPAFIARLLREGLDHSRPRYRACARRRCGAGSVCLRALGNVSLPTAGQRFRYAG